MNLFSIFIAGISLIVSIQGAGLPQEWGRCEVPKSLDFKNNKCILDSARKAIKDLSDNGLKDLGMDVLDPFKIKRMSIGQDSQNSSVRLVIDFKNMNLLGLRNLTLNSLSGKLSSPNDWSVVLEGFVPKIILNSVHKIDGSVLIFPVSGTGDCIIDIEKVNVRASVYGQPQIKDGVEYLKITNDSLSLDIKGLKFQFDGLFNGNKLISENVHFVLNQNWDVIYKELRPSMEKGLMKYFVKYAKKILEKIPFNELFITE